ITGGTINPFAGTGAPGFSGEGGIATAAELDAPSLVGIDAGGNVLIVDQSNNRIRRVDATGTITTISGAGAAGLVGGGGPASAAQVESPSGLPFDSSGVLFFTDGSDRVRRIDTTGRITTIAGAVEPLGMGPIAQAHMLDPLAVVVTPTATFVAGGVSGTVQ